MVVFICHRLGPHDTPEQAPAGIAAGAPGDIGLESGYTPTTNQIKNHLQS